MSSEGVVAFVGSFFFGRSLSEAVAIALWLHLGTVISALVVLRTEVLGLVYMVKRPLVRRRLSRRAIFYRDGFRCQYCGKESKDMTLDHIMPRSRGGPHVWENVVSACIPCNHRKAGLTPKEANMRMLKKPTAPRPNPYYMFHHRSILEEWRQFMPWME